MTRPNLRKLQSTIASMAQASKANRDIQTQLDIIKICKNFMKQEKPAEPLEAFQTNSINNILKFKKFNIDNHLVRVLKDINSEGPIPKEVIKEYITSDPKPPASKVLSLVKEANDVDLIKTSIRLMIYKYKNYSSALSLVNQSSDYLSKLSISNFRNSFIKSLIIVSGLNYSAGYLSGFAMSYITMLELYSINLLLLKSLVIDPMFYSSPFITWLPGTSHWKKITNYQEFLMYSKVVEEIKECYYLNVSNFNLQFTDLLKSFISKDPQKSDIEEDLIKELRKKQFILVPDQNELMYKEYWESAGNNEFEWVEPDRDPVEFLKL